MINLNELTSHHPAFHNIVASRLPHYFAGSPQAPKSLKSDLREARKRQNLQKAICGRPASTKPFGKRLSPCAETSNHLGNDFRHARKLQTIRETTFAMRGNSKPFGK